MNPMVFLIVLSMGFAQRMLNMNKVYSLSKPIIVLSLVITAIILNWSDNGARALLNGIIGAIALFQSWIILVYETK